MLIDTNIRQIHIDIILSYKMNFFEDRTLTIFMYNIFENI